MEKKDFYEYAVKSNIEDNGCKNEDVARMRDNKLRAESAKVIEAANYILENGFDKMYFEKCITPRFRQYDYNWAQIYIPQLKLYLFFVENKEIRDAIFQIHGKYRNILIFDMDVEMDYIGSEIARKIVFMQERGWMKDGERL